LKIAGLLAFLFTVQMIEAQNLVPNPGFELFFECPDRIGQIDRAKFWYSGNTGTPEYFRLNCPIDEISPHAGRGYAGLILFGDYEKAIEYIGTELNEELKADHLYCLSFHIQARESFMYIDQVGVSLSNTKKQLGHWHPIYLSPQLESAAGKPIVPQLGWHKVESIYRASGGEKFLLLGNFKPSEQHIVHVNEYSSHMRAGWDSYYFIDDVSVIELGEGETCHTIKKITQDLEEVSSVRDTIVVFFFSDVFELTEVEKNNIRSMLGGATNVRILELKGHTDSDGEQSYNLQLSEKRVQQVNGFLQTQGCKTGDAQLLYLGETEPLNMNKNSAEKSQNRRVEIILEYDRKGQ
jgi:OOP family OmpA-OmpF porin